MSDAAVKGASNDAIFAWMLRVNSAGLPVVSFRDGISHSPPLATQGLITSLFRAGKNAGIVIKSIVADSNPTSDESHGVADVWIPPTAPSSGLSEISARPVLAFQSDADNDNSLAALLGNNYKHCSLTEMHRRIAATFAACNALTLSIIGEDNLNVILANPNSKSIRTLLAHDAISLQRCLRCIPQCRLLSWGTMPAIHLASDWKVALDGLLDRISSSTRAPYVALSYGPLLISCTAHFNALPVEVQSAMFIRAGAAPVAERDTSLSPWVVKSFTLFMPQVRDCSVLNVPATAIVVPLCIRSNKGAVQLEVGVRDIGMRVIIARPALKRDRRHFHAKHVTDVPDVRRSFTPSEVCDALIECVFHPPTTATAAAVTGQSDLMWRAQIVSALSAAQNIARCLLSAPSCTADGDLTHFMDGLSALNSESTLIPRGKLIDAFPGAAKRVLLPDVSASVIPAIKTSNELALDREYTLGGVAYAQNRSPRNSTVYWSVGDAPNSSGLTAEDFAAAWLSVAHNVMSGYVSVYTLSPSGKSVSHVAHIRMPPLAETSTWIMLLLVPAGSVNGEAVTLQEFCSQLCTSLR